MNGKWLRTAAVNELDRQQNRNGNTRSQTIDLLKLPDENLKEMYLRAIKEPFQELLISYHDYLPKDVEKLTFQQLRKESIDLLRKRTGEAKNFRGRQLHRLKIDQLHALARKHTRSSTLERIALQATLPPVRYIDS